MTPSLGNALGGGHPTYRSKPTDRRNPPLISMHHEALGRTSRPPYPWQGWTPSPPLAHTAGARPRPRRRHGHWGNAWEGGDGYVHLMTINDKRATLISPGRGRIRVKVALRRAACMAATGHAPSSARGSCEYGPPSSPPDDCAPWTECRTLCNSCRHKFYAPKTCCTSG